MMNEGYVDISVDPHDAIVTTQQVDALLELHEESLEEPAKEIRATARQIDAIFGGLTEYKGIPIKKVL